MSNPFCFKSELWVTKYTGRSAKNLSDFLEALRTIDQLSIFYHFYINIFNYHNLPTYYTNSFAFWFFKNGLVILAEKVSVIDPLDYYDLEDLRKILIKVVEQNLSLSMLQKELTPFYFITVEREIIDLGCEANNLEEFREGIKKSSIHSIFYHFITARLNKKTIINDYSSWLHSIGEVKKAEKINRIHPFMMTLYDIKREIIKILGEE